jgi:hypothetical protein
MTLDGPVHILTANTGLIGDGFPYAIRAYCGRAFRLERDVTHYFHAGPHLWFSVYESVVAPSCHGWEPPSFCFAFRTGAPPGLALPRPLSPYCEECLAHYTVRLLLERDRPALSRPDAGLYTRS